MVKPLFKVSTPQEVITMLKDYLNLKEITQNNIEEVDIKTTLHRFLAEERKSKGKRELLEKMELGWNLLIRNRK